MRTVHKNTRREIFCKAPSLVVKAEGDNGALAGYASVTGVYDQQNDRMMPGAFTKTLQERINTGKVPLMIRHVAHGGGTLDTIGKAAEGYEDETGLFINFDLFGTDTAQEVRGNVKAAQAGGFDMGLSIGFIPVGDRFAENDRGGFDFYEARVIEVTLHPTPVNDLARVTGAKAFEDIASNLAEGAGAPLGDALGRVLACAKAGDWTGAGEALDALRVIVKAQAPEDTATAAALYAMRAHAERRKRILDLLEI